MKTRIIALIMILSILLMLCTGCALTATMPYSSDEYESGEWTADELVEHFKGLGFSDIKVEDYTTYDISGEKIQVVVSEDSTSWFPSYRDFEKGETIDTMRTIIIRETKLITSVSAYYSTKRDLVSIYIDDIEKKIYWTSKQSSVVHVNTYEGSILDITNGIIDDESFIYKIEDGDVKKYTVEGRELQSYSISEYNTKKPSYEGKEIK